ncbi:MAG: hypothetical protein RMK29_17900 [Myxococcales bacterium]|nr:hypothetical protein [Myxococcota bacterium]MDW8283584.1 hypothetical protein [Myxococcales bacterium]
MQDLSAPDGTQSLRTCTEIRAAYEELVGGNRQTACSRDEDCHLVFGQCGRGLGGCYHAVNHTVRQADVDALGDRYQELMCFGPVCACAPPPPVECRTRRCVLRL